MKIRYIDKNFRPKTLALIAQIQVIVDKYQAMGYNLTLRQLFYQLVSQDIVPNTQNAYSNLGTTVSNARRAGLLDWNAIEDRTRHLRKNPHWESPKAIVRAALNGYREDKWRYHKYRPMVIVEKEALAEVVERAASDEDVEWFSARGYPSDSSVWRYAQRCQKYVLKGQIPVIIHLGDHDPSGIDMTRDLEDRVAMFTYTTVEVRRIALNYDQVQKFDLVPNPAKLTDSRIDSYIMRYGVSSWELDALEPQYMEQLIRDAIDELRQEDPDSWDQAVLEEEESKKQLEEMLKELK